MSGESRPESRTASPWSILYGQFIPEQAFYGGRIRAIEEKVKTDWKDDVAAPRILVADIVQEAVEISQPELFTEPDLRRRVAKDIGSSVFASYSYGEEDLNRVEELIKAEIDLETDDIPALKTAQALLEGSEISLPSGQDLERVCHVAIYHILLKQRGRGGDLPPPSYN